MTPTDEQLERWAAEVLMEFESSKPFDREWMGKGLDPICGLLKDEWHPLTDLNQTFMCVEKMREKGWELWLIRTSGTNSAATFCKYETMEEAHRILDNVYDWIWDTNPARAIHLAMWRALEVV